MAWKKLFLGRSFVTINFTDRWGQLVFSISLVLNLTSYRTCAMMRFCVVFDFPAI